MEALRGCGLRYSKRRVVRFLCCRSRRQSERCAAVAAEAFAWRIFNAAFRKTIRQRHAAIAAELSLGFSAPHFEQSIAKPPAHRSGPWASLRSAVEPLT